MTRMTMMLALVGLATACGNGGSGGGGGGGGKSGGGGGDAGVDPCAQAETHLAECGTTPGTGGSSNMPCTGARACQAACFNAHTCAQITADDPGFTGCVAACQGK